MITCNNAGGRRGRVREAIFKTLVRFASFILFFIKLYSDFNKRDVLLAICRFGRNLYFACSNFCGLLASQPTTPTSNSWPSLRCNTNQLQLQRVFRLLNDRRHSKSGRLRPRCSSRYLYIYFSRKPT